MRVTLPAVTGHPLTFLPVRALATPLEKGLSPHQPELRTSGPAHACAWDATQLKG